MSRRGLLLLLLWSWGGLGAGRDIYIYRDRETKAGEGVTLEPWTAVSGCWEAATAAAASGR